MDFKNYEANECMHNLDMLIVLHPLHVLYPTKKCQCREKSIHLKAHLA